MSDHHEQGSFVSGFSIGLLAGAAGYFLFGTDKGRQIKAKLAQEWSQAQLSMPERGSGVINFSSLSQMLKSVATSISVAEKEGRDKLQTHRLTKAKNVSKKSKPKFKGV